MTKIVQVPMEEQEALALAGMARKMGTSRADLIRKACRAYLDRLAEMDLVRQYEEGYRRIPESSDLAETGASLAGEILPPEEWS